jgi:nitrite reductase/ring-hydroxylating ferredoxin subunit
VAVEYLPVAEVAEVPSGRTRIIKVAGTPIALLNVDGTIYALEHSCPHQGGPIGEGRSRAPRSPVPGTNGSSTSGPAPRPRSTILAKTFAVKVVDGLVLVEVSRCWRRPDAAEDRAAGDGRKAPETIGRELGLSPDDVAGRPAARVGERLQYLAELYLRKGRVGGSDLNGLPHRRGTESDGEMLSALDALTRLL